MNYSSTKAFAAAGEDTALTDLTVVGGAGHVGIPLTTDPFVTTDPSLLPLEQVIERSDIMILRMPHSASVSADFRDEPVIDVRGFLKRGNVVRWA